MKPSQKGWICISKAPETTVRADDGYLDSIGDSYEWVSKLPNGTEIQVGDFILIRDSDHLIGFSVIDNIEISFKSRSTYLCPTCKVAKVRERKTKFPKYMCTNCSSEFEHPIVESGIQEHRRAIYGAGWVSLDQDSRTFQAWKILSKTPRSQHSMQPVNLEEFMKFTSIFSKLDLANFNARTMPIKGGHKMRTVKTRIGQGSFRNSLFRTYGSVCAATGENHPKGLEAAHLYSYSNEGKHHSDGGLLFRRDIHYFFDKGLIAINPASTRVDLHPELIVFDQYRELQNSLVKVPLSSGVLTWLDLHWSLFRDTE